MIKKKLAATEAITQAIQDEYKLIIERYFGIKHSKKTITAIVIFIAFVCGIPMITKVSLDHIHTDKNLK